ncbi:hypothetical protein Micbo1qcDRAFT_166316 [Microdochium bolleyi]|uniref:Glycosyltransferase family 25 protein n=1 Tax=Microdochium bolleyi TaxID=196109 RepID=A0A136IVF7_9PEZI|nr:hypothetical protein Micbo1qcDRAFT_166316 [Microdochium bolleyi]
MNSYPRVPRVRSRVLIFTATATIVALFLLAILRGSLMDTSFLLHASLAFSSVVPTRTALVPVSPQVAAANGTLGFEKLLALSAGPSWRTRGLAAAADLVGLEITIPRQPPLTDEAISSFQALAKGRDQQGPEYGSAKAWLAHIDLLRHVVASDWRTAFILEDDVDFDIALKEQMQLVSRNVRDFSSTPDHDTSPYGSGSHDHPWDVLWPGHCGSLITNETLTDAHTFSDDTRIDTAAYAGWSKRFLRDAVDDGLRAIHDSHMSVCTFGYGVTAHGARKIIRLASTDNGAKAFDVAMSDYCKDGRLRCLVVNPQVFHHYQPPVELGYVSQVRAGDGKGTSVEEDAFEGIMGSTANIVNSARCRALFGTTCLAPPWEL